MGLLHLFAAPTWVELLVAIVAFDLIAQYGVHWCLHNVKPLWRLHMVHHSDTHVDVTTGTRHHPLDFVVRECFALVAVLMTGAPLAFYLFYRILTVFFTYLTHANIELPERLDRAISWVFVSPNMHKFHHHFEVPWTDRNYGNMLTFGTVSLGRSPTGTRPTSSMASTWQTTAEATSWATKWVCPSAATSSQARCNHERPNAILKTE